jgi:hypothetical protein
MEFPLCERSDVRSSRQTITADLTSGLVDLAMHDHDVVAGSNMP